MGFERTTFVVNETDGFVELCVNVTVPASQDLNSLGPKFISLGHFQSIEHLNIP